MNFKNAQIYHTESGTFSLGAVCVENGRIAGFEQTDDAVDLSGALLIPGLVDIHTHGRAGGDFTEADGDKLCEVARSYARCGTTTVVPTLASAPFSDLLSAISRTEEREEPGRGMARFLGLHLEGRYLSPARRGAHAPGLLHAPDLSELALLKQAVGSRPFRISMAPELEGAREMIEGALEMGVIIGIAHTDCSYAQAMEAVSWGASIFTHQFNAMRPFHHRDPGTVGAGLLSSAACELICDGFHLHPGTVALAQRVKDPSRVILITDSMAGAGCPDGEYAIAGLPVTVKDGKCLGADGTISGSTLDLYTGMRNYLEFTACPLSHAINAATVNPARYAGIDDRVGSIEIGKYADFLVLHPETLNLLSVYVGGEEI